MKRINKALIPIAVFVACMAQNECKSQLSGTYTVGTSGGEDYSSLTNAGGIFDDLNSIGASSNVTIQITTDLSNESGTFGIPQLTMGSIRIEPSSASIKIISHSSCGTDLIKLNDADNCTIDGRYSGNGRYLRFESACSSQNVFVLNGDCESITIRNCEIASENNLSSTSQGGAIHVSDNQVNGSDNFSVMYNKIMDLSGTADVFDGIQVNAPGSSGGVLSGLVIRNNEFSNINGKSIYIIDNSGEVNSIQVLANHIYGTTSISGPGTGWAWAGVQVESGSGHIIRGNYIGGQGKYCNGAKMSFLLGTGSRLFAPIRMSSSLPNANTNLIDSNIVQNMDILGAPDDYLSINMFRIEGGNCEFGTLYPNVIGDRSVDASFPSSASIVACDNYSSSGNSFRAFYVTSNGSVVIENNEIGGIHIRENTSNGMSLYLIYLNGQSAYVHNNSIGLGANNICKVNDGRIVGIYSRNVDSYHSIENNSIAGITASNSFDDDFYGIRVIDGTGSPLIESNTIENIEIIAPLEDPGFSGIDIDNPSPEVNDNLIRNISIATDYTGVQVYGIRVDNSGSNNNVTKNTLQDISLEAGTNQGRIVGIRIDGSGLNDIKQNYLAGFSVSSSDNSSYIRHIYLRSSNGNQVENNVIISNNGGNPDDLYLYGIYDRSSSGPNNIWHNTIHLYGTTSGSRRSGCYYRSNTTIRDIRNNIFSNRRQGGTGGHYAMYHSSTSGTMTCDYNLLYAEEDLNNLVRFSSDRDFSSWQSLGYAANSVEPLAAQALVDISTGHQLTTAGNDIAHNSLGVNIDHDNTTRPIGSGYDMGAFEIETGTLSSPLPVELLDFKAMCESNRIKLSWVTGSESNNNYFLIEQSRDGINWQASTTVQGMGYHNAPQEYVVYLDAVRNWSFYRLSQFDYDGKSEILEIDAVDCSSVNDCSVLVRVNENQSIIFDNMCEDKYVARIFDVSGRLVGTVDFDTSQTSSQFLSEFIVLPTGTYLIQFMSNHWSATKLIKI